MTRSLKQWDRYCLLSFEDVCVKMLARTSVRRRNGTFPKHTLDHSSLFTQQQCSWSLLHHFAVRFPLFSSCVHQKDFRHWCCCWTFFKRGTFETMENVKILRNFHQKPSNKDLIELLLNCKAAEGDGQPWNPRLHSTEGWIKSCISKSHFLNDLKMLATCLCLFLLKLHLENQVSCF